MRLGNFEKIVLVALTLSSGVLPAPAFSTDWGRAGQGRVQSAYPYANLPGVKAPTDPSLEPKPRS